MKKSVVLWLTLVYCLLARTANAQEVSLAQLSVWMTGAFSSEAQSLSDTSYFSISLGVFPLRSKGDGGVWLYVEQAMAAKKDKPYRQRVYCLTEKPDHSFQSAIYTLNDPLRFAGKPELVDALPLDSLLAKPGCEVLLNWDSASGSFKGATGLRTCPSDLRGASYATSEVELFADRMISWDRGYDKDGKQVWGAEKGGYVFLKQK